MGNYVIDSDTVKGVVAHMNEDHSDACLAIVRALGNQPSVKQAAMHGIDTHGVDFCMIKEDGSESQIRVDFEKPISRESQIRGHLVAMTKHARALTTNSSQR